MGEERVGGLTVDDEDEERSYNLEIKITLGEAANIENLKTLEAYLRRKFDTERIRVVARPRKTDPRGLYRRGIDRCPVLRREGNPIVLFRDGDLRARSGRSGPRAFNLDRIKCSATSTQRRQLWGRRPSIRRSMPDLIARQSVSQSRGIAPQCRRGRYAGCRDNSRRGAAAVAAAAARGSPRRWPS